MGGSETKIRYETVDKTDPRAQERGRQAARDENARLVREMEQRLNEQREKDVGNAMAQVRQQNERDVQRNVENKRRQAELDAKRMKEEKYRQEQLSCLRMKEALLGYEFGKRGTMKTFESEGLDVTDMKRVRIALFGPTGSGKTSFIGTLERCLLGPEKRTAFEQGAGAEGTVLLEEYLTALKFNLIDTRGFWNIDDSTAEECLKIMTGRMQPSDLVHRAYDGDEGSSEPAAGAQDYRTMATFGDRVHAVIFVIQAQDTRLKDKTYLTRMKKIRDHFRFEGHSPVTVITCEDKLKNDKDRDTAFTEASAATGSPEDRTYFITNYTHDHKDYSLATEKAALNIVDTVLLSAERFVKIQKLREANYGSSAGVAKSGSGAGGGETIKRFFNRLQAKHKLDPERVSRVLEVIEQNEINTVVALKACWEDIKAEVKMTVGMKKIVGDALKEVH